MTDETPVKRRTWVGEWVRSESFWRDVASRALSGIIVVALGAVAAAMFGIIDWITLGKVVLIIALFIAGLIGSIRVMALIAKGIDHKFTKYRWLNLVIEFVLIIPLMTLPFAVLGVLSNFFIPWIMAW